MLAFLSKGHYVASGRKGVNNWSGYTDVRLGHSDLHVLHQYR